jgi:hypothetical protein
MPRTVSYGDEEEDDESPPRPPALSIARGPPDRGTMTVFSALSSRGSFEPEPFPDTSLFSFSNDPALYTHTTCSAKRWGKQTQTQTQDTGGQTQTKAPLPTSAPGR